MKWYIPLEIKIEKAKPKRSFETKQDRTGRVYKKRPASVKLSMNRHKKKKYHYHKGARKEAIPPM